MWSLLAYCACLEGEGLVLESLLMGVGYGLHSTDGSSPVGVGPLRVSWGSRGTPVKLLLQRAGKLTWLAGTMMRTNITGCYSKRGRGEQESDENWIRTKIAIFGGGGRSCGSRSMYRMAYPRRLWFTDALMNK